MRVLACGGRDQKDRAFVYRELNRFNGENRITTLIQGGQKSWDSRGKYFYGTDYFAKMYAIDKGIKELEYKADWKKHGRAAGPIRNQQMIDEGKPDIVVAFPGGRGTADMVNRANAANIPVVTPTLQ